MQTTCALLIFWKIIFPKNMIIGPCPCKSLYYCSRSSSNSYYKTTRLIALKLHWDISGDPQTLICLTGGAAIFFSIFLNEFLCFTSLDFFSKVICQIVLKFGGYVSCGRVKQCCAGGGVAWSSWFLMNFSIRILVC